MFLDASVLVAILNEEVDGHEFREKVKQHRGNCHFSPLVRFEASMALARGLSLRAGRRPDAALLADAEKIVDSLLVLLLAEEVSISPDIGRSAIAAAGIYGKLVGHPAQLNFGDCFSYASAKSLGVPLLYRGGDFALIDLA